jgi:hypothetical protein
MRQGMGQAARSHPFLQSVDCFDAWLKRANGAHHKACSKINQKADVAQLVEQLIRNQQVIGSSPIVGSIEIPHSAETTFFPHCSSMEDNLKHFHNTVMW